MIRQWGWAAKLRGAGAKGNSFFFEVIGANWLFCAK